MENHTTFFNYSLNTDRLKNVFEYLLDDEYISKMKLCKEKFNEFPSYQVSSFITIEVQPTVGCDCEVCEIDEADNDAIMISATIKKGDYKLRHGFGDDAHMPVDYWRENIDGLISIFIDTVKRVKSRCHCGGWIFTDDRYCKKCLPKQLTLDDHCSVCLEHTGVWVYLDVCKHTIHRDCYEKINTELVNNQCRKRCPLCREPHMPYGFTYL